MDDKFYIQKLDSEFHPNDPHAPERRVFYVDVGDLSPAKAQEYLETIKQEITNRDR
jgi:hypothetical protein